MLLKKKFVFDAQKLIYENHTQIVYFREEYTGARQIFREYVFLEDLKIWNKLFG